MTIISKLYIKQHKGVSIRLTFPTHQIIFADGKRILENIDPPFQYLYEFFPEKNHLYYK